MPPVSRLALLSLLAASLLPADEAHDVVVYGGTSAGVMAAVQAKKMGKSVVIVGPDQHLGGLSSGGLGWTDSGKKEIIGGLAREFYHRVWKHYQTDQAWKWQKRGEYGNKGQGAAAIDGARRTMWIFEPHVAEQVFEDLVAEHTIEVHRDQWLDRKDGVEMQDGRILSIKMLSGRTFPGRMFIDATYEGDLLATAGVSYTVGRESNRKYGETLNGVQTAHARSHQFNNPVDPYLVPGDPSSGLVPRLHDGSPGVDGEGDHRVQAYCFRTCMTNAPGNRLAWPKPDRYDPNQYELALRYYLTGSREGFRKFDPIPNRKTDTNNHGGFSFDNIGYNYEYPDGSYEKRREIIAEHETYQKGLLWFLANDPRMPNDIRERMRQWGLAKDEFTDNGNWPHQIYVREARRMVSDWVQTEPHLRGSKPTPQPIGMGSYNMDSHNVQRYVDKDGHARNEGDIQVNPGGPYPIDYGAIIPKKSECENLLVPVCLSSSHIAYGSIRMEPVFMILGQSASTAACLSIDQNIAVQDLSYDDLRSVLLADTQILAFDGPRGGYTPLSSLKGQGLVIDDTAAKLEGPWKKSGVSAGVHRGYLHDNDRRDSSCLATFSADLKPGTYDVQVAYVPNPNRATKVPVRVTSGGEVHRFTINQRKKPMGSSGFHTLDTIELSGPTEILISNRETNGHVIIDAVRFVKR